jgi:hypothetical protein
MPGCSAARLDFRIIPAGFNAPLEFLTGFTAEPVEEEHFRAPWNTTSPRDEKKTSAIPKCVENQK